MFIAALFTIAKLQNQRRCSTTNEWIKKKCQGILLSHKENCNYVIFRKMDGTGDHHAERDKPSSKGQISHVLAHLWNLDLK
jgi:hypothetical protein